MKNIKNIIIVGFLLFSFGIQAQTGKIRKGDKSYEAYSYSDCIKKFEGVSDKTYEIKKKLAESYFKTGDFYKAEDYYKDLATSKKSTSEDVYNYASVLTINQKYKDAEIWMTKFATIEKGDSRAKKFLKNKGYYTNLLKNNEQFKINNLDINSNHQDFGTSYYLDKVVFVSTRAEAKFFKRLWNWNELPFLDLFIADNEKTALSNVKPFKRSFNKKYHEGPASYTKDGKFSAFTRNNYEGKSKDEVIKLKIFTSEKKGKKWKKPKSVHFNSNEYSVGHPSLTADGKKMYFASDMPGGFGGVDIWVVNRKDEGTWGIPQNLGRTINTEGNEMFPFIHESGILVYASNGLLGLGGLDIFYSKFENGAYLTPKNIGVPINSSYDDFALIMDKKMKRGYFSSNREEGKGDDDLYSFKILKELTFDIILKGKTIDKNNNILANTYISLYDADGNVIKTINSDEKGEYNFEINPSSVYKLIASKPKYISDIKGVETDNEKREYYQDLKLEMLPDFNLLCTVSEEKTETPISGVDVTCVDANNNSKTYKTFDEGEFLIKLNDAKLNDKLNYSFTLTREGYAPKTVTYSQLLYRTGEYKYDIKMQKIEVGEDLGKILEINPIYFDLDKSYIRPDAKVELDKIVEIMNEYPNMVIELSSHTDCRASSIYNLKLSDRRAKSSAHYIKTRISKPTRIYGEGFGETKLVNDCGCESNRGKGLDCSEEQHQQNRRTEFKIIRK